MGIEPILAALGQYDGPVVTLMEVCGTHTASIARNGIRSLLSPKIRLVSGPGCPVCVTPSGFIDALCVHAQQPNIIIATFGDMLKVPGTRGNLFDSRAQGATVRIVYSPFDALTIAKEHPDHTVVMAAVGFETTTPSYALLVQQAKREGIENLRLLTSLRRMPPVLRALCSMENSIDGFLAPGHVSAILGSDAYLPLAAEIGKPFVIAGFSAEDVLAAVYDLVQLVNRGEAAVHNLYPSVVRQDGNPRARAAIDEAFVPCSAVWRGLGTIADSGCRLRPAYTQYDAGCEPESQDEAATPCRCADVLCGKISPRDCPLFGTACTPSSPVGPCMVSSEGACGIHYQYE